MDEDLKKYLEKCNLLKTEFFIDLPRVKGFDKNKDIVEELRAIIIFCRKWHKIAASKVMTDEEKKVAIKEKNNFKNTTIFSKIFLSEFCDELIKSETMKPVDWSTGETMMNSFFDLKEFCLKYFYPEDVKNYWEDMLKEANEKFAEKNLPMYFTNSVEKFINTRIDLYSYIVGKLVG